MDLQLSELIKQRKTAVQLSAKFEQLRDLKRILLLSWNPTDGLHPLQLLPKEIWREILSWLQDPVDLQNASLSSAFFSELLEPRRFTDILFPLALKVDRFWSKLTSKDEGDALPLLRGTCKKLREIVDERNSTVRTLAFWFPCDRRDSYPELRRTLALFEDASPGSQSHPRLPITSWKVGIDLENEERDVLTRRLKRHFNTFCGLLKRTFLLAGPQLTKLDVSIFTREAFPKRKDNVSYSDCYDLLHQLVSMTPNIKCLRICTEPPDKRYSDLQNNDILTSRGGFGEILQLKPFPLLQKLQELELERMFVPDEMDIFEAVIRSNPQLKRVSFVGVDMSEGLLSAFNTLKLDSFELRIEYKQYEDLELLRKLRPSWAANLKEAVLLLGRVHVPLKWVFSFLEQFQQLTSLHLGFQDVLFDGLQTEKVPQLKLATLKVLKFFCTFRGYKNQIEYDAGFGEFAGDADPVRRAANDFTLALDYLLGMGRLEELHWLNEMVEEVMRREREYFDNQRARDVIRFNGGTANLCESNVWEVFPSLRMLSVVSPGDTEKLDAHHRGRRVGVIHKSQLFPTDWPL